MVAAPIGLIPAGTGAAAGPTASPARGRRTTRALLAAGAVCVTAGLTMLDPAPGANVATLDAPAAPARVAPDPFALHPPAPAGGGLLAPAAHGEAPATAVPVGTPPVELVFPARGVRAPVVAVRTGPEGALVVPEPPSTVGWWAPSALPGGAAGTTVLAGHVDSRIGGLGALAVLRDVGEGEEIVVHGADGRALGYRVTGRRQHAKAELPPEVFAVGGPPRLVLITCGGAFDRRTRHYSDNVVVVADPA